jgi:methionyl-tRNA synthetase
MLLAARVAIPRQVWAHGYVQWEGTKMSKTAGTAVTLGEAIERHGADALRYFLLREVGFEADGNFTWDRFDERYTADLADGFGNLASRSLSMLARYREGAVPREAGSTSLDQTGAAAIDNYARAMDRFDLRGGAEAAWELVGSANLYIQQAAPWTLAKQRREDELDQTLAALARALYRLAVLASPFTPEKAQSLWESLGQPGKVAAAEWKSLQSPELEGIVTTKPEILFPKPASV